MDEEACHTWATETVPTTVRDVRWRRAMHLSLPVKPGIRMHYKPKDSWSLSNLAHLLRLNLFTYRDLTDWLDDPFGTPLLIPAPVQLALPGLRQQVPA